MLRLAAEPARVRADPQKSGRVVGAAAATAATAALACGVCCVLPIALPVIALTTAGSVLAWLGNAHAGATALASVAVLAGWLWIWRQSAKSKARPASATLCLMAIATLALGGALIRPRIEPAIIGALGG